MPDDNDIPASTPIASLQGKTPYSLGPISIGWLQEAGIHTLEDLEALGSVEAYRRVKAMQPRASLNLLWGLEALILGIPIQAVDQAHKTRLKAALQTGDF